jgi:eukaryotic-like serine/threonine-protein kinase
MPLQSGARLGPYEVLAPLGAGGMGEVYRARDPRLGRDVAVKVLPDALRSDPDRLRRFEQEARAASALNHPNLLAVFDVGSHDGVPFVVSELLEGAALRERLRVGGVTPAKAIEWAVQIALGLAAAHEKGITHRDLKPENLFLTRDGRVKILDFGLAKLHEAATRAEGSSEVPTVSNGTEPGAILGTVGYMSPEQVRGFSADHRSDIFSFGAVLYEMLSKRRAFAGESSPEVMTAILKEDPPELASSVRNLSPALGRIVRRCLEKRPEERFHSAHDLALALEAISTSPEGAPETAPERLRVVASRPWMVLATALAALLGLLAGWRYLRPSGVDLSRYRFTPFATDAEMEEEGAWSPDGRSIAYARVSHGREQIFVRSLDADSPVQLTRGPDAGGPFWSADSGRILFLSEAKVWSVGAAGGEPELVQKEEVAAAALSPDGKTLATWRMTTDGGATTGSVWLASPPTAEPRQYRPAPFAVKGAWFPQQLRFSPDGDQILAAFASDHGPAVWLLPFPDGARARPHAIFTTNPPWQTAPSFSWMPDSRHVVMAFPERAGWPARLWMADTGSESLVPLTAGVTGENQPDVSPDGSRIVFTSGGVDHDLEEVPLDGASPRDLLATSRNEYCGAWLPGATRFVYVTDRGGQEEIRIRSITGDGERTVVGPRDFPDETTRLLRAPVVSPDGGQLAYDRMAKTGELAIWLSPVTGGVPARLTQAAAEHFSPTWSPDGKWLAFLMVEGGAEKLAKSRVGSSEPPQTLVANDVESRIPAWSPGGDWIAYASAEGLNLVGSDGKASRLLAKVQGRAILWSRDGASLYTIALQEDGASQLLSVDVRTGQTRSVGHYGADVRFGTPTFPGLRFTLGPDGRTFLATVRRLHMDLWLLEGFDAGSRFPDLFRRPASWGRRPAGRRLSDGPSGFR